MSDPRHLGAGQLNAHTYTHTHTHAHAHTHTHTLITKQRETTVQSSFRCNQVDYRHVLKTPNVVILKNPRGYFFLTYFLQNVHVQF